MIKSTNARIIDIAAFYDEFAHQYYESRVITGGRLFNEYIEMPAVLSLIPQKLKSKKVLDIGCGIGAYSRILGSKGAQVVAIDISHKMIEIATECCRDFNVIFENTSFQDFSTDQKFDLIIGGFMLGYFDDLASSFQKIKTLMNESGSCILSMIHPIKSSSIGREDGKYLLDNYFDENSVYESDFMSTSKKIQLKKWNFTDISDAAYKAGLYLDRIVEPTISSSPLNIDKQTIDFYNRCPAVLVIQLKKRK